MNTQTAIVHKSTNDLSMVVTMVKDALTSENSKRAYGKALIDFLGWYADQGQPRLSKAVVQRYKAELVDSGLSPASINLRLSAIRKLASEAADNGYLPQALANGIIKVGGITTKGVRIGNWLNKQQAQELIRLPDTTRLKGKRDRAILAVMLGGGLRRSEVAALTFEHIQMREARWVIVDLVGKHNRVRPVPIPSWAKAAIDDWSQAAGISSGLVFRRINKVDHLVSNSMTPQAVYDVVKEYSTWMGYPVAAHDLRRTFAKLARKGGSELTQIQLTLGHSNVAVTQKYIGEEQSLTDAPCDHLGLSLD